MLFRDSPTQQQAMGFLIAQTTYIEPMVYRIQYPELNYRELVPVDTSANEWAKSITFFSVDQVGAADWFNAAASDIPLADIARAKFEAGIEMAGIGYRYNLEELGQAMMLPNTNLTSERAEAARKASEEFTHNTAMYGDVRKNWKGITNHTSPAVVNAAHTWAYWVGQGSSYLTNIIQDFNGLLTNIWQSSLTVEMADTVLLPLSALTLLATTQLPNTTMTLLQFIMANNLYTLETGRPLTIRAVRGLDTAGASGNGRVIAYRKDPQVVKMHMPMPHRFFPVWQRGPFVFDVPGIMRMAGLEIRRPGAFRYLDGVC
jgi:hypothetical protein